MTTAGSSRPARSYDSLEHVAVHWRVEQNIGGPNHYVTGENYQRHYCRAFACQFYGGLAEILAICRSQSGSQLHQQQVVPSYATILTPRHYSSSLWVEAVSNIVYQLRPDAQLLGGLGCSKGFRSSDCRFAHSCFRPRSRLAGCSFICRLHDCIQIANLISDSYP